MSARINPPANPIQTPPLDEPRLMLRVIAKLCSRPFLFGLVVAGAVLRIWQYVANSSLWFDELALARNVVGRPLSQLLTAPLAFDQVAPCGFLLIEKLAVMILGPSEYVLRCFPLACALLALIAFWRLAERILDGCAVPVAVALFAAAVPLIKYGSQVKQYSSDVATSTLLLWLAFDLHSRGIRCTSLRRAVFAGAAGAVAVWFSQPAVLVLAGLGFALSLLSWREVGVTHRQVLRALAPTLLLWFVAALSATAMGFASMTPATREYMHRFWSNGFMPLPPMRALMAIWPWTPLRQLFSADMLGYPMPALYVALVVLGLWVLWRHRIGAAVLLLAPLGVTLAAAMVQQYPFSGRPILFLFPVLFLSAAMGISWLHRHLSRFSVWVGSVTLMFLVAPVVYSITAKPPVYRIEDVKPVLAFVESWRHPGDSVYVYYGVGPALAFYGVPFGLLEGDYVLGGCHRGEPRRYLEELDAFRGRSRVWVVIVHSLPLYKERENILQYLDTIGMRRNSLVVPSSKTAHRYETAEAYLYDLSDKQRLDAASSASFPLTGPATRDPRYRCGEGPLAVSPASPNPSLQRTR